jgi:glycine hydroxymethyltransferase
VVANAQALGRGLTEQRVPMVAEELGFTQSHQIHLDRDRLRTEYGLRTGALARRLERQRLLIDLLGRIGTAEAARIGLTPEQMPRMAELIARAGPRSEDVAAEVLAWRKTFTALAFA